MATKLIPARKLIGSTVKEFWRLKGKLVGAVSIVALPFSLLSLIPGLDQDSVYQSYNNIARILMVTGLIWLIAQIKQDHRVAIGDVYYRGIAALVRLFLLVLSFFMMMVPFLLGYVFYAKGLEATVAPSSGEKLLLGIIWAVIGLPSVWLLTRFLLSIYIVIDQDTTPVKALRTANRLVRGKTIKALGRIMSLLTYCILAVAILSAATQFLSFNPAFVVIFQVVLQLFSVLVVLPVANLYLFNLYQALSVNSSPK